MTENLAALEAFGLAVVLDGRGRHVEAAQNYRRALDIAPDFAEAHYNLANLYQTSGLLDEADPHYRAIPPDHPLAARAACNLGSLLARRDRAEEAAASFTRALEAEPGLAQARYGLARALLRLGRAEEAAENFRLMMVTQATHVEAREGLGRALLDMGRLEEAANQFRKVVEARPDDGAARAGLGRILARQGRFDEAERHLRKALDLDPANARRHADLGFLRRIEGRLGEAVAAYRSATLLAADDLDLRRELATTLLARGDFREGWEEFEARLRHGGDRDEEAVSWNGEDAAGRTLLVRAEGGAGDLIQFVRYLPLLADMGARVLLSCPAGMIPLMSSVGGVSKVVDARDPRPLFDAQVPLMSLPRLLGTNLATIPASVPYLAPDPDLVARWGERLKRTDGALRVGVVWKDDTPGRRDDARSVPAEVMARMSGLSGVALYPLQRGSPFAGARGRAPTVDLGPDLDADPDGGAVPWMDLAAVMVHMDLVVSVDSPMAHLAGALGRPTWIFLAFSADWRWLQGRSDSPWYPTARLFRQPEPGDWNGAMTHLVAALHDLHR
ncbi:MAG: tetratricopeptide repeat protein [Alphaproteobacteria bacterium]|nr:tetratricopeptide repeat protein [Alphaproteobacteria bacterium]